MELIGALAWRVLQTAKRARQKWTKELATEAASQVVEQGGNEQKEDLPSLGVFSTEQLTAKRPKGG